MSTEPTNKNAQERSPRFPGETLKDAIDRIEKLFAGLGRSAAPAEAVAKAIGFGGLSGASRTALAALSYYGLLVREAGNYKVSELALRIIRPKGEKDKIAAIREAQLSPPLFAQIEKDHPDCTESVLSTLLLHEGFTEDGSKRAAYVFKDNVEFAKNSGYISGEASDTVPLNQHNSKAVAPKNQMTSITPNELPVPIGDNMVARVPFPMSEEDFKLFIDTLTLWKNKLTKKPSSGASENLDD